MNHSSFSFFLNQPFVQKQQFLCKNTIVTQHTKTRAMIKTRGSSKQRGERKLSRRMNAPFCNAWLARSEDAATEILKHNGMGGFQGGMEYCLAMVCAATDRGPKPCFETMETQTAERVELYGKFEPPGGGGRLQSMCNLPPEERASRGDSFFRAEDIKRYLRDIEQEEDPKRSGGCGRIWRRFVFLVQMI
jgi:hypothetical protein